MGKYDEIMEKIEVTDEMKKRILSQIERVDISPGKIILFRCGWHVVFFRLLHVQ